MSASDWLSITKVIVLVLGLTTAIFSVVTFALTNLSEQEKKRQAETARIQAEANIARARADSEQAKAEAAQARKETAAITERLAETQTKLNDANSIDPISESRLQSLIAALKGFQTDEVALLVSSAPDIKARYMAFQIDDAIAKAGVRRRLGHGVSESFSAEDIPTDLLISHGQKVPRAKIDELVSILKKSGFSLTVTPSRRSMPDFDVEDTFLAIYVPERKRPAF